MENVKLTAVVKLKLAALKPHPRQFELFTQRSAAEDAALAEALKEHGLDHPVQVLPNLVLVAGHRRVAAAKAIGWTEISAIVREDLAAQGEEAIVAFLIRDNAQRRQLSPLERARYAFELKKIAAIRDNQYTFDFDKEAVRQNTRDWIGQILGISGREASRLFNVLRTPTEVQAALDDGRLTLVLADKVARLDREDQAEIAGEIRDGKDPKTVVEAYVAQSKRGNESVMPAYRKLLKDVDTAAEALAGRTKEVEVVDAQVDGHVQTMERGVALLRKLISHEKAARRRREKNMAALLEKFAGTDEPEEGPDE
jgi:ParB-like chromosome segregation protein Spo0J